MSSIAESQTLFYSRSLMLPPKHSKSLSSGSTNSGDSQIGLSSRKPSFQEETVSNIASEQLPKIPSPQKNASAESDLSTRQVEDQTFNKLEIDPMQFVMARLIEQDKRQWELENKLKEQEAQRLKEQEVQRLLEQQRQIEKEELERQRQIEKAKQDAIIQQLLSENQELKKKSTLTAEGLTSLNQRTEQQLESLERDSIEEIERLRLKLQHYESLPKI